MQLNIAGFYPSISEKILNNTILFVQQYIDIPKKTCIWENIVGNTYYAMIINIGRKNYRKLLRPYHGQFW